MNEARLGKIRTCKWCGVDGLNTAKGIKEHFYICLREWQPLTDVYNKWVSKNATLS